jgi:pyridoxamine 5'-phosphate oxidase family protein
MFSEREITYLKSQPLARLATVADDGQPDVAPVGFEFDGHDFYIGGKIPTVTRKYKNIKNGNTKVALVIDDLETVDPWNPRGIRIYGTAEIVERRGMFGKGVYLHVTPTVSWSWSLEEPAFVAGKFAVNKIVHSRIE